jgi:hypothetical protein
MSPTKLSIANELSQFQEQQSSLSTNLKYNLSSFDVENVGINATTDWMENWFALIQMNSGEQELRPERREWPR